MTLLRAPRDVGEAVQARAVRQRRGMQDGVAAGRCSRCRRSSSGRQNSRLRWVSIAPLGRPGGAAGVEQPGLVVGVAGRGRERVAVEQCRVVRRAGDENRRHRRRCRAPTAHRRAWAGKAEPRLRVGHDPGHLAGMQLAVERHRRQAGPPDAVERRQELRAVLHRQRHAGAGGQPVTAAQRAGDAGGVTFELAIRQRSTIPGDCGMIGELTGRVVQGVREVHGA